MSRLVIITVQPRDPATGAVVVERLAGGGQYTPYYFRDVHWRAGLADIPRFRSAIGFDDTGWTGGSIPTTATIGFAPSTSTALEELAALYWRDAPIVIEAAEEGAGAPSWTTLCTGTVASAEQADGKIVMTLTDLGGPLDRPVVVARFAGDGGIEGGAEAAGRLKRRTWGRAFNIEGRVFDKAYNIYEFGDPAFPWQSIDELRDIGRAGSRALLGWQGSIAATIAALRGAAAPDGGGVIAPSICMAKWWTQPNGPLTADVHGEIGAGYVESVPAIAARIVGLTPVSIANLSATVAIRGAAAGYHIDSDTETVANALDRLLLPVSLSWALDTDGTMQFLPFTLDDPIETIQSITVTRQKLFPPMATRRIGYQRAWRTHSDSEISSTLYAADVAFSNGASVETLKDVQPGATVGAPTGTTVHDRTAEQVTADLDLNGTNWFDLAALTSTRDAIMLARTTLDGQPIGTVVAGAVNQATTDRTATTERFALLGAKSDDGTAWIFDLDTAKVSPTESLAQRFSTITTTFGGITGSVSELRDVIIGPEGETTARAILALDVDGRIAGRIDTNTGELAATEWVFDSYNFLTPTGTQLFYADDDGVYMPKARVGRLSLNAAMVPARASATSYIDGSYGSTTGFAEPRTARLTLVLPDIIEAGWMEVTAKFNQGITTDGPWSASIAMNGTDDVTSLVGGGIGQDNVFTQAYFYVEPGSGPTITLEHASYSGIAIRERSMFVKFFPATE